VQASAAINGSLAYPMLSDGVAEGVVWGMLNNALARIRTWDLRLSKRAALSAELRGHHSRQEALEI
jgi:hypothetical protein